MIGISDEILNKIGGAVGTDSDNVINLGVNLGFQLPVTFMYVELNHQSGNVSPTGTKKMLSDWKRKTSSNKQKGELRKALKNADLLLIAENHLPENEDAVSYTETVDSGITDERYDRKGSSELLCLNCDTIIAKIQDVIYKKSDVAVRSKVRKILGETCLVQLMDAYEDQTNNHFRYDVITLTTAEVTLSETVRTDDDFGGSNKYITTWCTGCSYHTHQIGWYYKPTDGRSKPFHVVFLQSVIHDTYDDSNSSLSTSFQEQMNISSKPRSHGGT